MNRNFKKPLYFFIPFLLLFVAQNVDAQKKDLTLDESVVGQYAEFNPENLSNLHWIKGTSQFFYVDKKNDGDLIIQEAEKKSAVKSYPLSLLNQAIASLGMDAFNSFPYLTSIDSKTFRFESGNALYTWDYLSNKAEAKNKYPAEAENVDLDDSFSLAYTIENNLYVSLPGKGSQQITTDGKYGLVNGKSVHRDEFGIHKGTFWAPGGKVLAWYRMDESMVTDYSIYDFSQQPAGLKTIKYPMAGATSHRVQIGVYNTETKKNIFLETGKPDEHYLTNISWDPEAKYVFVAELNREQNYLTLNQYDATTGKFVKTLFEEKSDKYVQPLHGMLFVPGKNNEFIWQSERDGFNHLYHYNTEGKLIRQLTSGPWIVTAIHGFDEKNTTIFYSSTEINPCQRHTYSVKLDNLEKKQLNSDHGTHSPIFNDAGTLFINHLQSTEVPRNISIRNTKGDIIRSLLNAENPLKDYLVGDMVIHSIMSADATPLWSRIIYPVNFDATKKYPVLIYVYNGPTVQLVTDTWQGGSSLWMQFMASQGWIVFAVDGRGSSNRGRDFEQATFRNLGSLEVEDQLAGVKYLKSLPYVDGSRISVHGWSYGGFMTTAMMLRSPGTFKAGVAGGPVIDWSMYEVMYTERYMDTPQENPEGYKNSDLRNAVKNLTGKLMLIHGTSDDVVLWQHSLAFIEKCVKEKVQVDYFVYPGHEHNVRGKDRIHLMRKVLTYIIENT